MEPADQRRDDFLVLVPCRPAAVTPQWSPPTSGGTTDAGAPQMRSQATVPQWSPPTSGGTTAVAYG